ncbi:MAG: hypothetical protein GY822_21540 [Deltaproteobacteria bacterium]|nr:hypothetical protein [Deltaproteobacteria bacterium]
MHSLFQLSPRKKFNFLGGVLVVGLLFTSFGAPEHANARSKMRSQKGAIYDAKTLQGRWLVTLHQDDELQRAYEIQVLKKSIQAVNLLASVGELDGPMLQFSLACAEGPRLCVNVKNSHSSQRVYVVFRDRSHASLFTDGGRRLFEATRIVKTPKGAKGRFRLLSPFEEGNPSSLGELVFGPQDGKVSWVKSSADLDDDVKKTEEGAQIFFLAGTKRGSWETYMLHRGPRGVEFEKIRFVEMATGVRLLTREGSSEMSVLHRGPPPPWLAGKEGGNASSKAEQQVCKETAKKIKKVLRNAWRRQQDHKASNGSFAKSLKSLRLKAPKGYRFEMAAPRSGLQLRLIGERVPMVGDAWEIREEGKVRHLIDLCSS